MFYGLFWTFFSSVNSTLSRRRRRGGIMHLGEYSQKRRGYVHLLVVKSSNACIALEFYFVPFYLVY